MKVVWICNVPNKDVYKHKNIPARTGGGWLTGLSEALKKKKDVELVYCYPATDQKEQDDFIVDGVHYYSFYSNTRFGFVKKFRIEPPLANKYDELQERQIRSILQNENPDIIHIFGTEYYHSLVVIELCGEKSKVVCSIQGLTSVYDYHFLRLLPYNLYRKINVSCLLRGTLLSQQKNLSKRGLVEKYVLEKCNNVIGRTDWDQACTYYLNKNRQYYFCNETLRDAFYNKYWDYSVIEKHSIFLSQASSPLKGLNILIEAMRYLKKDYPDMRVRIAGNDFIKTKTLKDKIKLSTYGAYIKKLISKYNLEDMICFIGPCDEEQMVAELLRTNVFVSPSSIENSSNSIGEAMLIGVPVVSSDVGGIKSLLKHEEEGLIYQADAPYMLAYNIKRLFDDEELCKKLSENGRKRALITHDPEKNTKSLLMIYNNILKNSENKE